MMNTQSFNTPQGIKDVQRDFGKFQRAMKAGQRALAARAYNQVYRDTLLFPPCNVVNSLRDDLMNYQITDILSDLQIIKSDRDKIKY